MASSAVAVWQGKRSSCGQPSGPHVASQAVAMWQAEQNTIVKHIGCRYLKSSMAHHSCKAAIAKPNLRQNKEHAHPQHFADTRGNPHMCSETCYCMKRHARTPPRDTAKKLRNWSEVRFVEPTPSMQRNCFKSPSEPLLSTTTCGEKMLFVKRYSRCMYSQCVLSSGGAPGEHPVGVPAEIQKCFKRIMGEGG